MQRSTGWNLGVTFIAAAVDLRAADLAGLPEPFLSRLAATDALLQNADRTDANPNVLRDPAGTHWAIDFGACLLVERLIRGAVEPRVDLPPNHFLAGREESSPTVHEVAAAVEPAHLDAVIGELPDAWREELGPSRASLVDLLRAYMERLRDLAAPHVRR